MILKRKFKDTVNGERLFDGYEFVSVGARTKQHLHVSQVKTYEKEGVATVDRTSITLHCTNGDKVFNIDHKPGIYCLHCEKSWPLDTPTVLMNTRGKDARDHITANHTGKISPDPCNPSGYRVQRYYDTTFSE